MSLDLDKKIVALCASHSDLLASSFDDIKPEYLKGHYRKIYKLLEQYYLKHKKLPSQDLLEQKLQDNKDKIFDEKVDADSIILSLRTEGTLTPKEDYDYLIDEVRDRSSLETLNEAIPKAVHLVKKERKINEATDLLQEAISQIRNRLQKKVIVHTTNHDYMNKMKEKYEATKADPDLAWGIKTGFHKLDQATFGLKSGEMMIISARHGNGKSMWLLSACVNMFKAGHNIVLVSLEMPYEQYWQRFMACYADIPTDAIISGSLTPEQEKRYYEAIEDLKSRPNRITIIDMPHSTVSSMAAEIATIGIEYNPDILAIDYLGIVKANDPKLKDNEAQATVVEEVRALSRVLKIPTISAVQLNREPGKGKSKTKGTERLSRSDVIGATADVVLQIEEIDAEEAMTRLTDRVKIFVIKNRKGRAPFDFEVRKNFAHARFEDWVPTWGGAPFETVPKKN